MEIEDIIFIDNLPKLDLHGFDRETARVAVNDFVKDNLKMNNHFVSIVHGIGSGVIKATVHEQLRKNKNVVDFKTFYYNQGCTIVKIAHLTNRKTMV